MWNTGAIFTNPDDGCLFDPIMAAFATEFRAFYQPAPVLCRKKHSLHFLSPPTSSGSGALRLTCRILRLICTVLLDRLFGRVFGRVFDLYKSAELAARQVI